MIYHFILTRFNLTLWTKDKNGAVIDRGEWLRERLYLFETYCLPSVKAQECQDFIWVLLCERPHEDDEWIQLKEKIDEYKRLCPRIRPVWVRPKYGRAFASIFRNVTIKLLRECDVNDEDLCLTTYLDNDDMLHPLYVQLVQQEATSQGGNRTAISYNHGLQYFTELGVATRISYPNNHFMTFVENVRNVRTCYGYGSHFLMDKNGAVNVYHINNRNWPMWVEVIHGNNVDNDMKMTLDTTILGAESTVAREFGLDVAKYDRVAYNKRFARQLIRRLRDKIIPRKWE